MSTITKGRVTIRRNQKLGDAHDPVTAYVGWKWDAKPGTSLARLEAAYLAALDSVDRMEATTASLKAAAKLTPTGLREESQKFAINGLVPALHKNRQTIAKVKQEVDDLRASLKLPTPDPADVAAAFRRMEIRTMLRDMKPEAQVEYLSRAEGQSLHPDELHAITELPARYSGVSEQMHTRIIEKALEQNFGPQIAELQEITEAIEIAERATRLARNEVRTDTGLPEGEFNALAAPIEAKGSAPWLRRVKDPNNGTEEIRVVDLERGIMRPADKNEVEAGIYYRDHDHYLQAQAA